MVPNIYIQQLIIHSGGEKQNKLKQKEKVWHKWPHLEFHSIFNQVGTNPHLKKKICSLKGKGNRFKKKRILYFAPPPQRFSKPVVAWLKCSECTILKAGLFIQRNCWHSLLVRNYGRKTHSSKSQTWSKKASFDCSNRPVNPEFHRQNPCPVGFVFPFPSLRKGQCVVQAGELAGLCLPNCTASPPPAPLNWHLMSRSPVCCWIVSVTHKRPLRFDVDFVGERGKNQFCQQVLITGSCYY